MDRFSFDWWLALYDKANTKKWEYTVSISKGNEDAIPKYTRYGELAKWIRQRLNLRHYDDIADAVLEYQEAKMNHG